MLSYLRRHHVALLALLVALGGTSYAATQLPAKSVGTTQLKSKSVTEPKLAKPVREKLNRAGTPGPAGPQGPQGSQGSQGPQGIQGVPGPTSVGIGGTNVSVSPGSTVNVGSPFNLTLDSTAKVLVIVTGTFGNPCTGTNCGRTLSVQVDGTTVPGALATVGNTAGQLVTMMGVLPGVGAGTHQVQLRSANSGSITSPTQDFRILAMGIGG